MGHRVWNALLVSNIRPSEKIKNNDLKALCSTEQYDMFSRTVF